MGIVSAFKNTISAFKEQYKGAIVTHMHSVQHCYEIKLLHQGRDDALG
jgi:hypothetical protein